MHLSRAAQMCNKMGLNAHNTATRHTDQKESVDKSKDSI